MNFLCEIPWRRKWRLPKFTAEISPPHPLGPDSAPHGVVVRSISGNTELLVTWQQEPGELQEHVVDWIRDGDPVEDLNWVRLPPGTASTERLIHTALLFQVARDTPVYTLLYRAGLG